MKLAMQQAFSHSVVLTSLKYFQFQVRYVLGMRRHASGATHFSKPLGDSVDYIEGVFADYLKYAGISADDLAGKDILEVGPGDNLGVALCFIAKGARSVTCIDRFDPKRDEQKNARIYRLLMNRFSDQERERVQEAISFHDEGARLPPERVAFHYGFPIEKASEHFGAQQFDYIISRAVLEHVGDLEKAWDQMVRLLKPNGEMWHKVDFRNHGLFDRFHPLYFLTISEFLWKLMSFPDPTLNRERLPTYKRLARADFQNHHCLVTHVLQGADLHPYPEKLVFGRDYADTERRAAETIRPKLSARFKALTDEELLASGIFLICRAPRSPAARTLNEPSS